MLANPPLISSKLCCAEVYYSRTFESVKYKYFKLCSPTQPSFQPFGKVKRTNLHCKRCCSPYTYLNPKHSLSPMRIKL